MYLSQDHKETWRQRTYSSEMTSIYCYLRPPFSLLQDPDTFLSKCSNKVGVFPADTGHHTSSPKYHLPRALNKTGLPDVFDFSSDLYISICHCFLWSFLGLYNTGCFHPKLLRFGKRVNNWRQGVLIKYVGQS